MITFCGVVIVLVLIVSNEGKLPADIRPCKVGDKTCLIDTINKIIETKYKGDPDLNLVSIDPLHIDIMKIEQRKTSPVSVDLTFRNSEVYGYKDFRAFKVRGFGANPEGHHSVYFKGPYASMVGDYSVNGKVLILPVVGEGKSNITLVNVYMHVLIDAGSKIKNGAAFMDVKSVKLKLNTTRVYYDLSNLFNGDTKLGDSVNKFANENWEDVYIELRAGVLGGFGKVFTNFIKALFASHPYKELIEGGN